MVEALAKDDVKTLEDFATCADWELAGGWTTVEGKRVKDDGLLEPFDVSLEDAQNMIMTARLKLGWVTIEELEAQAAAERQGDDHTADTDSAKSETV
jgi:N utilization substance protein A